MCFMALCYTEKLYIYRRIEYSKDKEVHLEGCRVKTETQCCSDTENKQEISLSTGDWLQPGSEQDILEAGAVNTAGPVPYHPKVSPH